MAVIANRYAKALVDVSFQLGQHERVEEELKRFNDLLLQQTELFLFYTHPAVAVAKKKAATAEILARLDFCKTTSNFILILIDKHRMGYFAEILSSYRQGTLERLGVVQVAVTTSAELDPEVKNRLGGALEALTGKKAVLQFETDSEIIGGVITRIGDTIYDGSIRQQLQLMKARLSSEV